jgi:hypothetical protein
MKQESRENGYYWVKIKRTGIWIIAKWMQSYQWWVTMNLENDVRGGYSEIDERRITREPDKIIRRRRR